MIAFFLSASCAEATERKNICGPKRRAATISILEKASSLVLGADRVLDISRMSVYRLLKASPAA
jgi:hypothetical protein